MFGKLKIYLILFATVILSWLSPLEKCEANIFDHVNCVESRWSYLVSNKNVIYYYDKETIVIKNKNNPFKDKIVDLWVRDHFDTHEDYFYLYSVNIDKKYIVLLKDNKRYKKYIQPNSVYEAIYVKATELSK